jgi:phage tail protein X
MAYPRMEELCLAITLPKSGLSATYEMVDGVREKSYFRNWWMTTGAVPDANPAIALIFPSAPKAEITLAVSTPKSLPITRKTGFLTASLATLIKSITAFTSSASSLTGT